VLVVVGPLVEAALALLPLLVAAPDVVDPPEDSGLTGGVRLADGTPLLPLEEAPFFTPSLHMWQFISSDSRHMIYLSQKNHQQGL
jgi:hypothetical protein